MLRSLAFTALALFGTALVATSASACDARSACEIPEGSYFIAHPPADMPVKGALVFLHGYGGNGAGTMRNAALVSEVTARGYAFVAPNGMPRGQGRNGLSWSFHPDFPTARDEPAFFSALFEDLAADHGIDRDRILMGGFSAGGFMTSYLACSHPDIASAFVPVSGGFWRPHPETCAGPVRMFHTHGWSDTVVPLEGRFLRNGAVAQGDIFHGMDIWRQANGCDAMRADRFEMTGAFWVRGWDRCAPDSALEFALFPGGHKVPAGWVELVLNWYETLPLAAPANVPVGATGVQPGDPATKS